MRLVCGIVRFDGDPVDPATVQAMADALGMPHLSPRVDRRVDGSAGMAVLDFASASRACDVEVRVGADGRWLAADARLDRPLDLGRTLGGPATTPFDDLLLAAAGRWEADLPDRVDGDFALATWEPASRRLLCARDIAGTRPLCYSHVPGRWCAFASLPRGLHASGVVAPRPDLLALGRMLVEVLPDMAESGYRDIVWLPAGHSLIVTPTHLRLHQAWQPDVSRVGCWRGTAADAAATLRTLIEDAVACRLPAEGSVAADLSGGLDSSAVTVIAARLLRERGQRLAAFSQLASPVADLDIPDERPYVNAVLAQEPDIRWSPVHVTRIDLGRSVNVDLPAAVFGMTASDMACAAAAETGATLLLSGAGGDEGATYNGSALHAALLRQGHWLALSLELHKLAKRNGHSISRTVWNRLVWPLVPDEILSVARRVRGKSNPPAGRMASLHFLADPVAHTVRNALSEVRDSRHRPSDRVWILARSYLSRRATFWSVTGAAHGVALTHPLMDRRVLDFVLSLPIDRLVADGWTRQPFRAAMEGVLPEAIRWRETKFVGFPDIALHLVEAKPRLLAGVAGLRGRPEVEAFLKLETVEAAIRDIPDQATARTMARDANRPNRAPAIRRQMTAVRALAIAERVALMS